MQPLFLQARRTLCFCLGQVPDVAVLVSAVGALARMPCERLRPTFVCGSPLAQVLQSPSPTRRLPAPNPHRPLLHHRPWFAASLGVLTPNPIGASAGLSTAPDSAICRNNDSVERL